MRIQNTLDAEAPAIKIVVAGEAGNGKTTLARTIEQALGERVLLVSAEAGLLTLRGSSVDYIELQRRFDEDRKAWIEVPKQDRVARLVEVFKYVSLPETMARYKWLFIDSLTEINQNVLEFLESQPDFQGPANTIKKYGELSTRMRGLCKAFRDLPHYNVVFSALVKNETDSDNRTTMSIDMTGKFAHVLPSLFDEIFYLGVTPEQDAGGRHVRMLLTQKTDKVSFPKDRSGRLARLEPADLGAVVRKIRSAPLVADLSAQGKAAAAQGKAAAAQGKAAAAQVKAAHSAAVEPMLAEVNREVTEAAHG
jgi:hypothetical protein